jgi:hypothetical protein
MRSFGHKALCLVSTLLFTRALLEILAQGFEMKIMYVNKLPLVLKDLDPTEFELALYDQFRIDRFRVDRTGAIVEVDMFSKNLSYFDVLINDLRRFFEEAWRDERFRPVTEYIEAVNRKIHEHEDEVQYTRNWLLQFDNLVRNDIPPLPSESSVLVDYLKAHVEQHGQFRNYLDVGVCTGRYPELLVERQRLVQSFDILDRDEDSEMFLQVRHPDWEFRLGDIRAAGVKHVLSPPYDLITCMLATVSHFGLHNQSIWHRQSGFLPWCQKHARRVRKWWSTGIFKMERGSSRTRRFPFNLYGCSTETLSR